eukprot:CAMPEP_0197493620 /NCGR_PEP_ID=MMETSP1311-20131121/23477_1 /TAXON_ID=464262 /ORGANISM="Genus nov. species nov., Strain RCC856" /LENGTH=196 /DNA_ID=CAMNT_0043038899 /DNA_START=102 /DNA_END=692 /DNA_ORIENTATION=+
MVFGLFGKCKDNEEEKAPENLRAAFAPLGVLNPKGEAVKLGDVLAKDKPVLLWVMRRFSCPFCRAYAVKLRDHVGQKCAEKGVQMVGLGLEMAGIEAFVEGKFWGGDLLVENEKQEVHALLNLKRASILKMFDIGMLKEGMKLQKEFGGNSTEGDGFVLGGVFIMDKAGKCVFEFKQKNFRKDAEVQDILSVLEKL